MGVGRGAIAIAALVLATLTPGTARADVDRASAVTSRDGVDWVRGLVTAEGIGVANRAAPTPAAARGPARRLAEDAARKRLAAQLPALPLADGGKLETRLGDPAIKAAIDRAVANAFAVTAELETDGSWRVTMAVPVEAIRQALARGARVLGNDPDAGPAVVIVDGAAATPAVGYKLGTLAAATVFVTRDVPAWAKGAPRLKAKGSKAGVIDIAPGKATEATLFVIVGKS